MEPVTRITRRRVLARHDVPLDLPKGDSDLLPIAVFLWICGAARVAVTLLHGQSFDGEASLALLYVIALPLHVLRARYGRDTERQ